VSLPSTVDIDDCPVGDGKCRWCKDEAHWSTTAYSKYGVWTNLCDRHLGKLLRRLRMRSLRFELPDPIISAEASR
jgi:hypothetical protein